MNLAPVKKVSFLSPVAVIPWSETMTTSVSSKRSAAHADTIKAAVAHALGTHLDHFQRIVISPCSISAIVYGAAGPVVLTVNSTGDDLRNLVPS